MGISINNAEYFFKDTIIGALYLNTVTILLPQMKEEDG